MGYAILDELESCRSASGAFTMKLSWPESDLQDQTWTQTSNPVTKTSGGVDGYACSCSECSCPYSSQYWGGLEYNNQLTLLDGSVSHSNWFYGVGGISGGAIHVFACVPAHLRVAYCTAAVTGYVAVL